MKTKPLNSTLSKYWYQLFPGFPEPSNSISFAVAITSVGELFLCSQKSFKKEIQNCFVDGEVFEEIDETKQSLEDLYMMFCQTKDHIKGLPFPRKYRRLFERVYQKIEEQYAWWTKILSKLMDEIKYLLRPSIDESLPNEGEEFVFLDQINVHFSSN